MKSFICTVFLVGVVVTQVATAQSNSKSSKQQYAFIIVLNKEAGKLYFSQVFGFQMDRKGDPLCDLGQFEETYRQKVADEKYDVLTSDYFDTKDEAIQARSFYIDSEKKSGKAVVELTTEVANCN